MDFFSWSITNPLCDFYVYLINIAKITMINAFTIFWVSMPILNLYGVAHSYFPTSQNPGKYSFPRHDTVPGQIIDGAFIMANLADLGDLHQGGIPQCQTGSHRDLCPINSRGGYVFGEIAEGDLQSLSLSLFYALRGKKTRG